MKRMLAVIALTAVAFAAPASAQDAAAQLVGTWKYVSQSLTEVQSALFVLHVEGQR